MGCVQRYLETVKTGKLLLLEMVVSGVLLMSENEVWIKPWNEQTAVVLRAAIYVSFDVHIPITEG